MEISRTDYYIGTITEIIDVDLYEVKVTVPGVLKDRKAYPMRGEVDEPKVGDAVIIQALDPVFHSFYLYRKLKENKVIGFRSRGKKVTMTEDEIVISTFAEMSSNGKSTPYEDNVDPEPKSWIKISKEGNIDVFMEGTDNTEITKDTTIKIHGKTDVTIDKDCNIKVDGKADIKVTGECKIKSPNVKITGGNLETVNGGTAAPNGMGGFCGIPVCPFTGATHIGNKISGT